MPDSEIMPSLGERTEPGTPGDCVTVDVVGSSGDVNSAATTVQGQNVSPLREEDGCVDNRRSAVSPCHQQARCSDGEDNVSESDLEETKFENSRVIRPANSNSPSLHRHHHHLHPQNHRTHTSNNNHDHRHHHQQHTSSARQQQQHQQQQQRVELDHPNGPKLTAFSVLDILDPKKFTGTTGVLSPATSPSSVHDNGNHLGRVSPHSGHHWSSWSPPVSPTSSCKSDGKH